MKKIYFITLGCNKNQVDSEYITARIAPIFQLTGNPEEADIIIISGCSFLKSARDEAEDYITEYIKYKENKCSCLIVSGCFGEYAADEIINNFADVDIVVGIAYFHILPNIIKSFYNKTLEKRVWIGSKDISSLYDKGLRVVPYGASAYVKISDGCDNRCSYCLIPAIRGSLQSRSIKDIKDEVVKLADNGVKEINLLAQDIGSYGIDRKDGANLYKLLTELVKIQGIKWIRLLYLHPRHINEAFAKLVCDEEKICSYLDIPLQHINDKILQAMNRNITSQEIIEKIEMLRKNIPELVLRTTFIVGFPGETNSDFNELLDFAGKYIFDKIGVFCYSEEQGTKAVEYSNKITQEIKEERFKKLIERQEQIAQEHNKKWIGKELDIIVENYIKDKKTGVGRMYGMAPDVDGVVYFQTCKAVSSGQFVKVKIIKTDAYDMYGTQSAIARTK
ncbi:MAG: 30S ribosomal protein S12 methylthiotransferase RimO [Elusimicrobiota bacterium]